MAQDVGRNNEEEGLCVYSTAALGAPGLHNKYVYITTIISSHICFALPFPTKLFNRVKVFLRFPAFFFFSNTQNINKKKKKNPI